MSVVSASALTAPCGHVRALRKLRKPTADQQVAMDRGTRFHVLAERFVQSGEVPVVPDDLEIQGWLDLFASLWNRPPMGLATEIPWGLNAAGEYVAVTENEPHVYVSKDGSELLTAGRSDLCWIEVCE